MKIIGTTGHNRFLISASKGEICKLFGEWYEEGLIKRGITVGIGLTINVDEAYSIMKRLDKGAHDEINRFADTLEEMAARIRMGEPPVFYEEESEDVGDCPH